jgi:hypothetical protein
MAEVPLLQADNVAGSTKPKKKPKAGKGSMIYFADGYFEQLQKKASEEDPEIGEIVANMVDMGGRVSAGQDKLLSIKINEDGRSHLTNRKLPEAPLPDIDARQSHLKFLFTRLSEKEAQYMWFFLTGVFITQLLMIIGLGFLFKYRDLHGLTALQTTVPWCAVFAYICVQHIYICHDVMHGATFPPYWWMKFLTHPLSDFINLPWEEFVLEHNRHHASTVDLLTQGEFGWDPEMPLYWLGKPGTNHKTYQGTAKLMDEAFKFALQTSAENITKIQEEHGDALEAHGGLAAHWLKSTGLPGWSAQARVNMRKDIEGSAKGADGKTDGPKEAVLFLQFKEYSESWGVKNKTIQEDGTEIQANSVHFEDIKILGCIPLWCFTCWLLPVIHFLGLNDTGGAFCVEWYMHFPEAQGSKCHKDYWAKFLPRRIKHHGWVLFLWTLVYTYGNMMMGDGWWFVLTVTIAARCGYGTAWFFVTNFTHSHWWNELLGSGKVRTNGGFGGCVMSIILGGRHRWNEMLFHDLHHAFPNKVGTLSQRGRFHGWRKVHDAAEEVILRDGGLFKQNGDAETKMQKMHAKRKKSSIYKASDGK